MTRDAIDLGWRLVELGRAMLTAGPGTADTFRTVFLALAAKSLKSYQAVLTLCAHGFGEAALVTVRTIFEDVVNTAYISQQPEKRAPLFADFNLIEKKRLLNNLDKAGIKTPEQEEEWQADWEEAYQKTRRSYLTKRGEDAQYWSGLNVKQMCEAVDNAGGLEIRPLLKVYHLLYVYVSQYTHGGSPLAASSFLEEPAGGGEPRPLFMPSASEVEEALSIAFGLEADMLKLYARAWNLPTERVSKLEQKEEALIDRT